MVGGGVFFMITVFQPTLDLVVIEVVVDVGVGL